MNTSYLSRGKWLAPVACVVATLLVCGCAKHPAAPAATSAPAAAVPPTHSQPAADQAASDRFFDPKENPGAVIGEPVDPRKLTASELQYGIAPKRDPRVTYAPDVIVMEQGDKAIKMAASDGMTWVFDAAAPHVSEFEEGRIVFATGRAVGRIGQMTRNGATVTVRFAPVQITEVIQEGHFLVDSPIRTQDFVIYTAPDFPSIVDLGAPPDQQAMRGAADDEAPHLFRTAFIPTQGVAPAIPGLGTPVPAPPAAINSAPPLSLGNVPSSL